MDRLLQNPLFWMFASALAAPLCFWLGSRRMGIARIIDDTPTSRVRSAAQGYVEVTGRADVAPGGTIRAPLTRRECVWWRYRVEERQNSGRNDRWRTVSQETSEETFLLSDDSGACVVDPGGAEVYPSTKRVWYGSTDWPAEALGTSNVVFGAFQRYRYIEYLIPTASTLNIIGEFRTLGAAGVASEDDDVAALLRQWKLDQPALMRRFDANHDGVLNELEWQQARETARAQVRAEYVQQQAPAAVNVLARPGDQRPFLIAADLHKVARRARWQAAGAWLGFIGCAGLFTWLAIHR